MRYGTVLCIDTVRARLDQSAVSDDARTHDAPRARDRISGSNATRFHRNHGDLSKRICARRYISRRSTVANNFMIVYDMYAIVTFFPYKYSKSSYYIIILIITVKLRRIPS